MIIYAVVAMTLIAAGFVIARSLQSRRPLTHRDVIKRNDGTPKYDDIWGAP
ncbi:MAG: hypothetical protein AAGD92_03180 [Pseudomonadota bacterium]